MDLSKSKIYKGWRILGTGFSFAVFGLGACLIALGLLLLLYPLPLGRPFKQRLTRHIVWCAAWLYVRMMWAMGLLSFEFQNARLLQGGGRLVIANHPTLLDVVFLMSVMPGTNCIVKAALFKNPFTYGVVSLAGYIPNDDNGEDLINRAAEAIANGQTLIIFPEGTRTQNPEDLNFKRGAANVALKARCPITPVVIDCQPPTLRKHEKWYQVPDAPPHFSFKALPPLAIDQCIDTARPSSVQARHLTLHMRDTIVEQLRFPASAPAAKFARALCK